MDQKEVLKGLLAQFFRYYRYPEAIKKAKQAIQEQGIYRDNWSAIKNMISHQHLNPTEPLHLITLTANLILDENSDNEAYKWLNLMIKNLERTDGEIEEY